MNIALFGITGTMGSAVAAEAAGRGWPVTGISRSPAMAPLPGVDHRTGDATDAAFVAAVAAEHDAVVSALSPSRAPGADPQAFVEVISTLAGAVGGTRLLVVGGAGSLTMPDGTLLLDQLPDDGITEPKAAAAALTWLRTAPNALDWTFLSPAPFTEPGERTGSYRTGGDQLIGERISIEDLAVAVADELDRPAHRRTRFSVAY